MRTYSHLSAPDLAGQLAADGILTGEAKAPAINHSRLLISQIDGIMENSAFDFDIGRGAGYSISLHIATDLPAFSIWEWQLELPWQDPQFQWLQADPAYSGNAYSVPGCPGLTFPREAVINHRLVLQRGHGLEGLLLGFSYNSIPDSYRHGASFNANLVLVDEMGRGFSNRVRLWVRRVETRISRSPVKRRSIAGRENTECIVEKNEVKPDFCADAVSK